LRYATSARNIKNTATRNLVKQISPEEAAKLARENQLLKKQVAELQALLQAANSDTASVASTDAMTESRSSDSLLSLPDQLQLQKDNDVDSKRKSKKKICPEVEVPALHMEIEKLKERLKELEDVENENLELQQQLSDAKIDAEAARAAASQLSDIMEKIKEIQEDEIEKKRSEYRHKQREEQWIDFVYKMMQQQGQQMVRLWHDFELIQKLVTTPIVQERRQQASAAASQQDLLKQAVDKKKPSGKWWDNLVKGEIDSFEDPNEYQMMLLIAQVQFYKDRMREVQANIEVEKEGLSDMKMSLGKVKEELLFEIGNDELVRETVNKENNVLDQLTAMLLQPATVLASQVPGSVFGNDEEYGSGALSSKPISANDSASPDRHAAAKRAPASFQRDTGEMSEGEQYHDNIHAITLGEAGSTKKGWFLRWRGTENTGTGQVGAATSDGKPSGRKTPDYDDGIEEKQGWMSRIRHKLDISQHRQNQHSKSKPVDQSTGETSSPVASTLPEGKEEEDESERNAQSSDSPSEKDEGEGHENEPSEQHPAGSNTDEEEAKGVEATSSKSGNGVDEATPHQEQQLTENGEDDDEQH